jgi:hypothetical protein
MTDQHPITPPPELVQQWARENFASQHLCTQAARWGADQELQACINFVYDNELCDPNFYNDLRNHRRPKPPSLKEQALEQLREVNAMLQFQTTGGETLAIRRALDTLDD